MADLTAFQADYDDVRTREDTRRRRERLIVTGFIAVVAALSVAANLGGALHGGVPALGRAALGVLGLIAAAALLVRPRAGWLLALAWAVIQIPIYAWSPDGSPTLQILNIPLTFTTSQEINGVVTSYQSIGVNIVGVALALYLRNGRRFLAVRPDR